MKEVAQIVFASFYRLQLFVKDNNEHSSGSLTYVLPFTEHTWLCTILIFSLLSIVYCLAERKWTGLRIVNHMFTIARGAFLQVKKCFKFFLFVYRLELDLIQGCPDEPQTLSLRIIFQLTFTLGIIIYTAYSAELTAILAVKQSKLPFQDMKTLYESGYQIFISKGTLQVEVFKVNKGIFYQQSCN